MEKEIMHKLIDLGLYEEFTVKEVRERAQAFQSRFVGQSLNNVVWCFANLPEFGDFTMNKIREFSSEVHHILSEDTTVPVEPVSSEEDENEKEVVNESDTQDHRECTEEVPPPGVENEVQQTIS